MKKRCFANFFMLLPWIARQGNSISFFQFILKFYRRRIAAKPLTSAGARYGGKCRRFVGFAFSFCRGVNFGLSDSRWRCPRTPAKGTRPFGNPRFANYFLNAVALDCQTVSLDFVDRVIYNIL